MAFKMKGWSPFTTGDFTTGDIGIKTTATKPPTKGSGITPTKPPTKGSGVRTPTKPPTPPTKGYTPKTGVTPTKPPTKSSGVTPTKPPIKGSTSTKPKGTTYAKAKPINTIKTSNLAAGNLAKRKIAKKIIKKVGTRLVPGLGWAALGYDVIKEVKSGGAGIKKNIKDVKKFFKKSKTTPTVNTNTNIKKKKSTYLDKQKNLNYKPQSKK